jgi:hypothetical protein
MTLEEQLMQIDGLLVEVGSELRVLLKRKMAQEQEAKE